MVCGSLQEKHLRIAEQCAPVLAGVKPANLLMLEDITTEEVTEMIRGSETMIYFLYRGRRKCAWLLYQEEKIKSILRHSDVQRFLKAYGYHSFFIEDVLARLCERAASYLEGEMEYPHELGVILGYPLEDVKGFIEYQGKNYLISGYWKVYGNVEKAQQTFALYHKAKREAVSKILCNAEIRKYHG